ncbi:Scr1 family TA system antitoxin-like transcriptional regulator [Actinokineospora xionganensis]|uniref:Helix-turn-helix domain-containing protein n=1 Tax=Actinokineospora xionganensis TaxID=2684470 RepID=A0ABR7L3V6_9PSEU|nr:Scr1 family TA system antitoxin-like transcriptional regulator [Actinokineospora xionganensis]MBC6447203.1 helix-turn-helix domain-containing protein [Actinokineospora xionganensis]
MGSRNRASARELGSRLQAYRDSAGLTLRDLAQKVGRSPAHLNRLENGVPGTASESEVVYYLASCGASYGDVERLLQFCRDANDDRGYWLCPSGEWMSDSLRSLMFHESSANQAVNYQPEVIPGLLQTEPYIQALLSHENISTERRQARHVDEIGSSKFKG